MSSPIVLREVESRFALGIAWAAGAALLCASFLGVELWDELLVAGWILFLSGPWLLIRGGRELTVDASRVTLTRKGKVQLIRPLTMLRGTTSLALNVHWVTFADGKRLFWLCPSEDWQPIADLLTTVIRRPTSWVRCGSWSRLDCSVSSLLFPERTCLGCKRPAVRMAKLTASRGLSLLLFEAVSARDIPVPSCAQCHLRRRLVTVLKWLPGGLLLAFLFAQISLRIPPPAAYWIGGTLLFAQLLLLNFGDRLFDRLTFGVHVRRFWPSLALVSVVFRDPEQGEHVARLSGVRVDESS